MHHLRSVCCSLAATLCFTVSFAQQKVITETTVVGQDAYVTHYFYNAEGNPFLLLTDNLSQQFLIYNQAGQITSQEYTDFTNANSSRTYLYTYNSLGQVQSEEEFAGQRSLGTTTYTYDEQGNILTLTNSRAGMPINRRNTYNDEGQLIKQETLHPMNPSVAMAATEYEYEGTLLIQETDYEQEVLTTVTTYTYDAMALCQAKTVTDPEGNLISTTTYAYADIDISFAPINVSALPNPDNTITLTWEGNANALIVDGKYYTLNGQTYTTPVLTDGQYTLYLAYDGNAVATDPVDVIDNSKAPVTNVRLCGDIYATAETILNYYGEPKEVTAYNIPIAWDLPDNQKPISYRIYYNSTYYVDVPDGTLRTYTVPAINMKTYNPSTYSEVLVPLQIRVIAIYATGKMEPDNLITFTLEETEEIIKLQPADAINTPANLNPQSSTQYYDLSGRPINRHAQKGIILMRQGDTVRKVLQHR